LGAFAKDRWKYKQIREVSKFNRSSITRREKDGVVLTPLIPGLGKKKEISGWVKTSLKEQ